MIGYSPIINQRGRNGMLGNISRGMMMGSFLGDVDFRYAQVPEKPVDIPKPTEVEYRPLPELDRKYIPPVS